MSYALAPAVKSTAPGRRVRRAARPARNSRSGSLPGTTRPRSSTSPIRVQRCRHASTPGVTETPSDGSSASRAAAIAARARRDVYAVRWENPRAGTSGGMPAVEGGWRKGRSASDMRHLPLTPEKLAAHLTGDVHVGLYLSDASRRPRSCRAFAGERAGAMRRALLLEPRQTKPPSSECPARYECLPLPDWRASP